MNEEKKNKLRIFIIYLLVFIVSIIFELFICKTVFASELVRPISSFNNNTPQSPQWWYGYALPTRATGDSSNNKVHITFTNCDSNNVCTSMLSNSYYMYLRDIDADIQDYIETNLNISVNSLNMPSVWSSTISYDGINSHWYDSAISSYLPYSYEYTMSIGFQPGGNTNDNSVVLSDGFAINYDNEYSYTFDILIYNDVGLKINDFGLNDYLKLCDYNFNNDYNCVIRRSIENNTDYISIAPLINDEHLQYYRISIFTNMYGKFGFNDSVITASNEIGAEGKNLISPLRKIVMYNQTATSRDRTRILISQPYNITMWTIDNTLTCIGNCWTQEDTNNNQRIEDPAEYSTNLFNSMILNIDYHGFSGIVNLTYDFIVRLLQSTSNNTCNGLNIPILSTSITMPSSCIFWGREDISNFESFTDMLWLGIISYFIAWRIYKDILKVYDPDSKLVDGNEVADL